MSARTLSRRVSIAALTIAALAIAALPTGCVGDAPIAEPPTVDRAVFEAEVYPILLRDCGFPACHGSPSRFFRVQGPGRARLDPATGLYAAVTIEELDASFDRARSMLSGAEDPRQALLLRKPLEPTAGGAAHMGNDSFGRNVYASQLDPSWRTIAAWAGVRLVAPDGGAVDAAALDAAALDGGALDGAAADGPADATIAADAP